MRGVNKVQIIGTLGADPEVKQFSNGGSITNISVATSEQWTDKQSGEKREATEWHRISLANKLGEIAAQYLRKGSKVYIEGKLNTRKYQAQDGTDRYVTEIKAMQMQMLDSKNEGQQQNNNGYQNNQQNNQNYQNNQAHQQQNNGQQSYQKQNSQQTQPRQPTAPQDQYTQNGGGAVDDDIPFNRFYDGQL